MIEVSLLGVAVSAAAVALAGVLFARRSTSQLGDVKGKWVLATGCDSGFGALFVALLVKAGARVIAFTYTAGGAKRAKSAGAALALPFDVTDKIAMHEVSETHASMMCIV
jgi:NADPH:quinone reductase-like Zn-dependent oxidoreductase